MRTRGRKDATHDAIVSALRQSGASVQSLASVGNGCPDLLVGMWDYYGKYRLWLMELKDGALPPSKRALTKAEIKWQGEWRGVVHIVYSVEGALEIIRTPSKPDPFEELTHVAKSAMEKAKE